MIRRQWRDAGVAMAELPSPEIVAEAEREGSVLVLPVGSAGQHGPHLPVSTDTLLAEAVSHGGAGRASSDVPVLVAPSIAVGHSPHHEAFVGCPPSTDDGSPPLLVGPSRSATGSGFDVVLAVNGHAGNEPFVGAAVGVAGPDRGGAGLYGPTYFRLAADVADELRETATGGMGHAGEFETSLALHLFPEHVRTGETTATYRDPLTECDRRDVFEDGPPASYRPFDVRTDSGVLGDPSAASGETGTLLYEHLCEELATLLEQLHETAAA